MEGGKRLCRTIMRASYHLLQLTNWTISYRWVSGTALDITICFHLWIKEPPNNKDLKFRNSAQKKTGDKISELRASTANTRKICSKAWFLLNVVLGISKLSRYSSTPMWRNGRRSGLKIRRLQKRVGSESHHRHHKSTEYWYNPKALDFRGFFVFTYNYDYSLKYMVNI